MIMNRPTATAPSVHHFLFSGVKRRARTCPYSVRITCRVAARGAPRAPLRSRSATA
jgi:hypothetical protein